MLTDVNKQVFETRGNVPRLFNLSTARTGGDFFAAVAASVGGEM